MGTFLIEEPKIEIILYDCILCSSDEKKEKETKKEESQPTVPLGQLVSCETPHG